MLTRLLNQFILWAVILQPEYAVAVPQLPETLTNPWFWLFYPVVLVGLRGLSELFVRLARGTENKWDNRLAKWFSLLVKVLGQVAGNLGYGRSKMLK